MRDHKRFNLKAKSEFFVLNEKKKKGNKIKNGITKQITNQSFQIGENINRMIFTDYLSHGN